MLFPRWLRAPSFDDAVAFFYINFVKNMTP